jgi:replicative DNA helicase
MYKDLRDKADEKGESLEGRADILVAKHRNGPTGQLDLHFQKQYTRFDSRTEREA